MRSRSPRSWSRRWPAATSRSCRSGRTGCSRSARSGSRSPPATRARSTSTCRSSTGARASRRSGSPRACAWTSRRSTATSSRRVATGGQVDVQIRPQGRARRDRDLPAQPHPARVPVRRLARGARRVRGPGRRDAEAPLHDRRRRSSPRCSPPSRSSSSSHRAARSTRRSTTPSAPTSRARSRRWRRPSARREALDQELDAQLVGLARLVTAPANRPALEDRPRLTLASDLHNNVLDAPDPRAHGRARAGVLRRRPDRPRQPARGSADTARRPYRQAVRVRAGQPRLGHARAPARRDGAVVLTRSGRLSANGETSGHPIVTVAGPARRGLRRSVRAPGRRELRRPLHPQPGPVGGRRASRPGCAASATTPTSSWSTTPR